MKIQDYIPIGKIGDIIDGGFGRGTIEEVGVNYIVYRPLPNPESSCQSAVKWNNLSWEIELINNFNTMNIKEKFLTSLKKEPEKSFRKAEITNGDDMLTEDGKAIFLTWLLQKNGEAFKKEVVDEILELKKEDEK